MIDCVLNAIRIIEHKIRQLFCRHDYHWCKPVTIYQCISGETHYLVCKKCGKVKDKRYIPYP